MMAKRTKRCPQLPDDLLFSILGCMELHQRLGSCSLVCLAWRDAAAAVTSEINIILPHETGTSDESAEDRSSFDRWLSKHGSQLNSLAVEVANAKRWYWRCRAKVPVRPGLHLRCPQLTKLQQLTATGMLLLLDTPAEAAAAARNVSVSRHTKRSTKRTHSRGSSSSSSRIQLQRGPVFLSGLSSLTSLQLDRCSISGWAGGLRGLSLLTQLQHLQLQEICIVSNSNKPKSIEKTCKQLGAALPHLVQLASLDIDLEGLTAAALQGLGQLQQLRELRLQEAGEYNSFGFETGCELLKQLPANLRVLQFAVVRSNFEENLVLDGDNTVQLCRLSSLVDLRMPGVVLEDAPRLLGALTQLTSLALDSRWLIENEYQPAPYAPFSVLQRLQKLQFGAKSLDVLQGLPLTLTWLQLCWEASAVLSSTTAPGIAQLTALQYLELTDELTTANICPSILLHMQQLRTLIISNVVSRRLPVLMNALQTMQQLQHLDLQQERGRPLRKADMQLYSALTASSHLTRLELMYDEHMVANGAARYMFAEGKQLPHLKVLRFGVQDWACEDYLQPFGQGDFARLAAACPALEELWLLPCIQPCADIFNLGLLTSVTFLIIGGWDLNPLVLTSALLKLRQLQFLEVDGVDRFGARGVAALTQLTALTHLQVDTREDQVLLKKHDCISLDSKASPPDVWRQLRRLCLKDKWGAAAILELEACQHQARQHVSTTYQQHLYWP